MALPAEEAKGIRRKAKGEDKFFFSFCPVPCTLGLEPLP
jgi:hypothetical protein